MVNTYFDQGTKTMRKAEADQIEADVEDYLVREVRALGGVAEKTTVLGQRGYFDRVVVLPPSVASVRVREWMGDGGLLTHKARTIFVELKRPRGGRHAEHQRDFAERYRAVGAEVALISTKAQVDALLAKSR